jgi:hypothetical protein
MLQCWRSLRHCWRSYNSLKVSTQCYVDDSSLWRSSSNANCLHRTCLLSVSQYASTVAGKPKASIQ